MKKVRTPVIEDKDEKGKSSWRMYDTEFHSNKGKGRKSYSSNKLNSSQPLNNCLSRLNHNYSTEKSNNINTLGKAGNNIITNMNKPPHLKVSQQQNDNMIHIRMPVNFQNKNTNQTTKNVFNLNFKDSIANNNNNIKCISVDNIAKVLNSPSNLNKGEEDKCTISISCDSEYILNHLNFIEIWVDTDLAIDNKSLFTTILNKYLKEFSNDILIKNIDMFNLPNVNILYVRIVKLSLLILVIAKFVLIEFSSYDSSLRIQLKKLFMTVTELYGVIGDIFIFDLLNNKIVDKKFGLIEKLRKMVRFSYAYLLKNKSKSNSNVNEILLQLNKVIDINLLTQISNFSQSYFNYGFYQPIFNVLSELLKQYDKSSLQKLLNIITECILFNFIKREGLSKQIQIDRIVNPFYYPNIHIPFLPPLNEMSKHYTLVLDLDETLVHFFYTPSGGTFFIRPHLFEFLQTMSQMFEIVIFTASMKEYADNILNLIDPFNTLISHRLYRQHISLSEYGVCKYFKNLIRDLSKIGRNMNKTIIIDNLVDNFKAQPNNGLWIKTWTDEMNDTELIDLMKILKDFYTLKCEDVRLIIKKINEIVFKSGYSRSGIYFDIDILKI